MDVKGALLIIVSIFGVLAVVLTLNGLPGQTAEWSNVGSLLAPFILLIGVTGLVVYIMGKK